jgi:N-acetylneuraminate synthase/N,N'-diacetyllegionaminate synthase
MLKKDSVYIIAEIGSNHDSILQKAKKMIKTASECGVDAVKFQTFTADTLYSKKMRTEYNMIKNLEIPFKWYKELLSCCKDNGVDFLSTAFDVESVDMIADLVPYFKISSPEVSDLGLLRHIAKKGKPIFLSTGISTIEEIRDAVETIKKEGNNEIILMHCTSMYPTRPAHVNLNAIETLRKEFGYPVGFSDHSLGIHMPIAAVTLGACAIEKHFTLNRNDIGPDHPFAIEPDELKQMVINIRDLGVAFGDGVKKCTNDNYTKRIRRSIHAKVEIREGEVIKENMLCVKRPGYGIEPKEIKNVLGKRATRDIESDSWITYDLLR